MASFKGKWQKYCVLEEQKMGIKLSSVMCQMQYDTGVIIKAYDCPQICMFLIIFLPVHYSNVLWTILLHTERKQIQRWINTNCRSKPARTASKPKVKKVPENSY